ncbi:transglutaminase-like domain-containing protein [Dokdonella fugitiva]|jgi:transglutaminase-like putative cysteine protease|uniref:Transglutaminase superfamily protein n=1 Tax=Dokdonella fugitiva TaxID=328517 RepID=A0A4R2HZ30_9GAMM|nr:transglutaminase-like putative cysteine protease [Dokdonella fugitiva]TCO36556.1 transglutaminase superfamily protein [Dokdonella fugitiva]
MSRRRRLRLLLLVVIACGGVAQAGDVPAPAAIIAMIDAGQFKAAESAIAAALAREDGDATMRSVLEFQRERMRRIRLDFSLDTDAAKARVRQQIPDLTAAEFAAWDAAGLLEHQLIDGELRYFKRAPSNLFLLGEAARARRAKPVPPHVGPMEVANAHHREARDAALASGRSSVAARHVRVTQSISVHADAVPAGEVVRAWLPYPREIAGQQEHLRFEASVPRKHVLAPASALQRTVYLEARARAGEATRFSVTYELDVHAQYHAIDADKVVPVAVTPELAPYLAERPPHIVFSEPLELFSRQIVGDEKNPWRIAQKLYAAVDRIPWAGAREYSTISNISDYALHAGHADCGQQTLLLMTLLRMNGIPTRWQSGWIYSDAGYDDMHDWGWLYVAPYGWVPMDVTFGRLDDGDPAIAGFYLGGLDAYRIAFNDDYGRELVPPKTHFRSETVDLQRGEVEWSGGNLYFDQWDYAFEWSVRPARAD